MRGCSSANRALIFCSISGETEMLRVTDTLPAGFVFINASMGQLRFVVNFIDYVISCCALLTVVATTLGVTNGTPRNTHWEANGQQAGFA